jgi:hypothetical protein
MPKVRIDLAGQITSSIGRMKIKPLPPPKLSGRNCRGNKRFNSHLFFLKENNELYQAAPLAYSGTVNKDESLLFLNKVSKVAAHISGGS